MKDNFFALLMDFFEKSLTRLTQDNLSEANNLAEENEELPLLSSCGYYLFAKEASQNALRVFLPEEQVKLTKASYQFIMRLYRLKIINNDTMEPIINELLFSESRYVTLDEAKWVVRNKLAKNLTEKQLAFLDLVLYQKEDQLTQH